MALVVAFWATSFLVNRVADPVASPLLDVIFVGYVVAPVLSFITLVLLWRAARREAEAPHRLPLQGWLAFAAVVAWTIGLGFLDLR
jgi:hypothetical protein